jgi:hypothetical protein|tara:strand:+ start:374 stop:574 length:201 start_codon:yes stop_codon:yes gene_type:complete
MAKLTKRLNQNTIVDFEISLTQEQLTLYNLDQVSFWSTYESEINNGWVITNDTITDLPDVITLVEV